VASSPSSRGSPSSGGATGAAGFAPSFTGTAAWAAAVVVLAALDLFGVGSMSALGVPGA